MAVLGQGGEDQGGHCRGSLEVSPGPSGGREKGQCQGEPAPA